MITYKQWIKLHEGMDTYTLGVKTPQGIGVNEAPMLFGMKKKMHGGDDMGDMLGKKKKPMPPMGDDMGDDMGGPPMGEEDPMPDDDMAGADDTDMDDMDDMGDDDEAGEDMDGLGDEEGGDDAEMGGEDMGGDLGGPGGPPPEMGGGDDMGAMLGKKKKMPPMPPMKMKYMKKEGASIDGQGHKAQNMAKPEVKFKTGKAGSKCCNKCSKMMTKEETEFFKSLQDQCGGTKFTTDEYGYWGTVQEDHLISPKAEEQDNQPGPGDVGYAPTQKLGGSIGSFQEWSSRQRKKK